MNLNCGCQKIVFSIPEACFGYIATGIFVISMEDAKLQNLMVEPVFFREGGGNSH